MTIAAHDARGRPDSVGTVTTTDHHPFYDVTRAAFVDAAGLKPGDRLQRPGGHTATVLEVRRYQATHTTYDLTINDLHTYYVEAGATPVLVHNSDGCGRPGIFKRIFGKKQPPELPAANGTVGDLRGIPHDSVDDAGKWTPDRVKRGLARSLHDDELLKSVFAPDDGMYMTFHDDIMMEGNHRMAELLRRADDPSSSITHDTPIYVDGW